METRGSKCSSRWGVFASECEAEASHGECSARCRELMNETLKTQQGATFASCTCTDKEDKLCVHLKDVILQTCITVSLLQSSLPWCDYHLTLFGTISVLAELWQKLRRQGTMHAAE
ncbi:unnamed protein product [Gongylonema pulchrum]|uniref:GDNF domain-containing protein n=1 Tax=Gongylonema pulchrum TaxID=637853 RepID=A0A183DCG0_9BILA|nr:unnamed protein product [Gongylonema pulchrum]